MARACGTYGGKEKCVQDFDGEHEGKSLFKMPSSRLDVNIR